MGEQPGRGRKPDWPELTRTFQPAWASLEAGCPLREAWPGARLQRHQPLILTAAVGCMVQLQTGDLGSVAQHPAHTQTGASPAWTSPPIPPAAACHPPACRPHLLVGTEGLGPPRWGPGRSSGVRATLRFDMGGPWRTHHRLKPPMHVYTGHPAKPVSGTLLTLMTPPPAPCRKPVTAGPLLARIFFTSNYDQMWTIESFDAS